MLKIFYIHAKNNILLDSALCKIINLKLEKKITIFPHNMSKTKKNMETRSFKTFIAYLFTYLLFNIKVGINMNIFSYSIQLFLKYFQG